MIIALQITVNEKEEKLEATITMPNGKKFTIQEDTITTPYRTLQNSAKCVEKELDRFAMHVASGDEDTLSNIEQGIQKAKRYALGRFFGGERNSLRRLNNGEVLIDLQTNENWML